MRKNTRLRTGSPLEIDDRSALQLHKEVFKLYPNDNQRVSVRLFRDRPNDQWIVRILSSKSEDQTDSAERAKELADRTNQNVSVLVTRFQDIPVELARSTFYRCCKVWDIDRIVGFGGEDGKAPGIRIHLRHKINRDKSSTDERTVARIKHLYLYGTFDINSIVESGDTERLPWLRDYKNTNIFRKKDAVDANQEKIIALIRIHHPSFSYSGVSWDNDQGAFVILYNSDVSKRLINDVARDLRHEIPARVLLQSRVPVGVSRKTIQIRPQMMDRSLRLVGDVSSKILQRNTKARILEFNDEVREWFGANNDKSEIAQDLDDRIIDLRSYPTLSRDKPGTFMFDDTVTVTPGGEIYFNIVDFTNRVPVDSLTDLILLKNWCSGDEGYRKTIKKMFANSSLEEGRASNTLSARIDLSSNTPELCFTVQRNQVCTFSERPNQPTFQELFEEHFQGSFRQDIRVLSEHGVPEQSLMTFANDPELAVLQHSMNSRAYAFAVANQIPIPVCLNIDMNQIRDDMRNFLDKYPAEVQPELQSTIRARVIDRATMGMGWKLTKEHDSRYFPVMTRPLQSYYSFLAMRQLRLFHDGKPFESQQDLEQRLSLRGKERVKDLKLLREQVAVIRNLKGMLHKLGKGDVWGRAVEDLRIADKVNFLHGELNNIPARLIGDMPTSHIDLSKPIKVRAQLLGLDLESGEFIFKYRALTG